VRALADAHEEPQELQTRGLRERIAYWINHLGTVGKPLAVGLVIVASASGLAVYFLVSAIWILRTRWIRTKRLRERAGRSGRPREI
jgi:uncharacterized protein (DUF2062 family)